MTEVAGIVDGGAGQGQWGYQLAPQAYEGEMYPVPSDPVYWTWHSP